MKVLPHIVISALVAAIVTWGMTSRLPTTPMAEPAKKETVFERVMRTGTIRCGYGLWPPALMKDPTTGRISGIYYDYLEGLGKELGLKIEWAQELDMGTYLEDLNNGRVDLECSGGWPNSFRGKFVDYTTPIYYNPVYLYARKGFKTNPNNLDELNRPDVRFSVMDGETTAIYRDKIWPKTTLHTVPGSAPQMQYVDDVRYGKADLFMCDHMSARPYLEQHPDDFYMVSTKPIFFIANNMSVPQNEMRFLNMLNTATNQMLYSGDIERILTKYGATPTEALRVALPYQPVP